MPVALILLVVWARVSATNATRSTSTPTAGTPLTAITMSFAPGACRAFAPLHGDRHRTVFVDAGHGGPDPGASGSTSSGTALYEKDLTLPTALDLLSTLRDDGYHVVMSRTGDTAVARLRPGDTAGGMLTGNGVHYDTTARVACANAAGANLLIAIHFDAYSDPSVGGAETLYDSVRPFAADNLRLADLAQQAILAQFSAAGWSIPDRGVQDDASAGTPARNSEAASYGHLLELGPAAPGWLATPSAMPGILAEPLFLTDPPEADIAASAEGQQALARGLAHAITAYFSGAS